MGNALRSSLHFPRLGWKSSLRLSKNHIYCDSRRTVVAAAIWRTHQVSGCWHPLSWPECALRSPQRCGPDGFPSQRLLSLLLCFVPRRVPPAGTGPGRVCWLHAGSHGGATLHLEDGPAAPLLLLPVCSPPRHLGKSLILRLSVTLTRCIVGFSWAWTHFPCFMKTGRERRKF